MCDIVNSVNYKGKSLLDSFVLIQFILYMLPTKASFPGPPNEGPECLLSSFGVQVSVSSFLCWRKLRMRENSCVWWVWVEIILGAEVLI